MIFGDLDIELIRKILRWYVDGDGDLCSFSSRELSGLGVNCIIDSEGPPADIIDPELPHAMLKKGVDHGLLILEPRESEDVHTKIISRWAAAKKHETTAKNPFLHDSVIPCTTTGVLLLHHLLRIGKGLGMPLVAPFPESRERFFREIAPEPQLGRP